MTAAELKELKLETHEKLYEVHNFITDLLHERLTFAEDGDGYDKAISITALAAAATYKFMCRHCGTSGQQAEFAEEEFLRLIHQS